MNALSLFSIIMAVSAYAQTVATVPTPFADPNPYQSQTWYRQSGGMIKTLSAAAGPDGYQFEHPNALPETCAAGSNFGLFKNKTGILIGIVDALGRFYQYDNIPEPEIVGGVYFTRKDTHELIVIDSDGAYLPTTMTAPSIKVAGGNYYFDQAGALTTIKSMGAAKWNWSGMATNKAGLKYPTAIFAGGNYYVDADNKITTIASDTGFFSDPTPLPNNESIKVYGGTYVVTSALNLYVVSNKGDIKFVRKLKDLPTVRGYSYLIFKDMSFIYLAGDGTPFDHLINTAMSGKPAQTFLIDPSSVLPTSVSKIGGVK